MHTLTLLALTGALTAQAVPVDDDVAQALQLLSSDPPIAEVQRAALEHFSVSPNDLAYYRAAARLKALLPAIQGSYTQDDTKSKRASTDQVLWTYDPVNPQIRDDANGVGRAYTASASWSLGNLIFDSNQLETYALVGIQEDVVTEVTRLYYTRQHNMLTLSLDPPKDARTKAALILRTREIESMLDALTGGVWSKLAKASR